MIAIINKTNLSYQEIGSIIDCLNKEIDTNYYGKICYRIVKLVVSDYSNTD